MWNDPKYALDEDQLRQADLTRAMTPEVAQQVVDAARATWDAEDERDRVVALYAARDARIKARLDAIAGELGGLDCDALDRAAGLAAALLAIEEEVTAADVEAAFSAADEGRRRARRLSHERDALQTLLKVGSGGEVQGAFYLAQRTRQRLADVCWPEVRPRGCLYTGPHPEARVRAERDWLDSVAHHRKPIQAIIRHAMGVLAKAGGEVEAEG